MQVSNLQQQNSLHLGRISQIALTSEDKGAHTITHFSLYIDLPLNVIRDIAEAITGLFKDNNSADFTVILYRPEIC
jgi:hypothetical protein